MTRTIHLAATLPAPPERLGGRTSPRDEKKRR